MGYPATGPIFAFTGVERYKLGWISSENILELQNDCDSSVRVID
jgi:hypothetical protein